MKNIKEVKRNIKRNSIKVFFILNKLIYTLLYYYLYNCFISINKVYTVSIDFRFI